MKDKYYLQARLFPTVLTSIPLLLLLNVAVAPYYNQHLKDILVFLPALVNIGLSSAVIFLFVQINRLVSKELFQKVFFTDEIRMPATDNLLWHSNYYPDEIRQLIHTKIKTSFGIDLLSKEAEKMDELKARKVIVSACAQIRNVTRESKLLLQHNIEYGFCRNLIGGSFIAVVFCVSFVVYALYHKVPLVGVGIILLVIYSLPILFSKFIIKRYGNYYAKVLIEQFLTIK